MGTIEGREAILEPMVLPPQEPFDIFGGRRELTQHMIALGHWNIITPSGGPH